MPSGPGLRGIGCFVVALMFNAISSSWLGVIGAPVERAPNTEPRCCLTKRKSSRRCSIADLRQFLVWSGSETKASRATDWLDLRYRQCKLPYLECMPLADHSTGPRDERVRGATTSIRGGALRSSAKVSRQSTRGG